MKKLVFLFVAFISISLVIACSGDEGLVKTVSPYNNPNALVKLPSTKVFVQGACISNTNTRIWEEATTRDYSYGDLRWPSVNTDEGWEAARFSIRIDGTIPGWLNESSSKYWGGFEGPNIGKIATGYGYGRYDDRGFDYTKRDTKTGENVGMFRYVYDESGVATQSAIVEAPDVATFLTYWRDKEKSETTNKQNLQAAIDGLTNNETKVLWYVVKEVGMQYGWHVNGILTKVENESVGDVEDTEVVNEVNSEVEEGGLEDTDPLEVIPDNVEVDIHLQEHQDWNEIKVSTHIRTDAGSVTINLPLSYSNIIEQDDFSIRVYDYYYMEYEVSHEVKHDENGITITISDIDPDLINSLKEQYGDGLTIEVHSYCTQLEGVWEELKRSTVRTGNSCTIEGQITSAYSSDYVPIN